jgi:ATP-dependent helicase HrpA
VSGEPLTVGQAFQPAGAGDFPVASSEAGNTGQESPVNRQVGKPALQPATPVYAWPGIALEDEHISIRLFRSPELARTASLCGVRRLIELALAKDIAWLQKDLRGLSKLNPLYAPIGSGDELQETAYEHLLRHAMPEGPLPELTRTAFEAAVNQTRERLRGLVPKLSEQLTVILQLRQQIAVKLGSPSPRVSSGAQTLKDLSQLGKPAKSPTAHPLTAELAGVLPSRFLEQVAFDRLPHLPRYLKALLTRIERAKLNPPKDQERARQLAPFQEVVKETQAAPPKSVEGRQAAEELRWLVEEFKVSLFAQELGTAVPVSAKRLEQQVEQLKLTG